VALTKTSHETHRTDSNSSTAMAKVQDSPFTKKKILLKVLAPALVMLLVISSVSALVVVLSVCLYDRRKK